MFPEQIGFHKFPNHGSTRHEHRPLSIFFGVFISLFRNSLFVVLVLGTSYVRTWYAFW